MSDAAIVLTKHEAVKQHVLGLKQLPREGVPVTLLIGEIAIGDRLIPLDAKVVAQLIFSIREIRQTTPVLVRCGSDGSYALIDGLNRIEALKQLGETEVHAVVVNVASDEEARACEAISNNHRRQKLTALDRALTDFATLQYVERRVSQVATPPGGRQPKEKFHKKTARELGVSPDQIARSCKIAKLDPYVQRHVRKLNLEDNQSVLLEIARSGDDVHAQVHTLAGIMNRTNTGRSAPKSSGEASPTTPAGTEENVGPASSSSHSGSPEEPIPGGSNPASVGSRTVVPTEGETVQRPVAPTLKTQSAPQGKQTVWEYEAIKQEWEKTGGLLNLLLEVNQEQQQRFFEECMIPIFSKAIRMAVAKASI